MSCSSDTSAYTTELDRTGATAGVPTSVTTASKTPGTMRVMGSSSQSIDDVCTAVSRTLLQTPPTRSANTCAARAPLHLSLTATSVHLKRELTANELAFDGADPHSMRREPAITATDWAPMNSPVEPVSGRSFLAYVLGRCAPGSTQSQPTPANGTKQNASATRRSAHGVGEG